MKNHFKFIRNGCGHTYVEKKKAVKRQKGGGSGAEALSEVGEGLQSPEIGTRTLVFPLFRRRQPLPGDT